MTAIYITIGLSILASAMCIIGAILRAGSAYDDSMGLGSEDSEEDEAE